MSEEQTKQLSDTHGMVATVVIAGHVDDIYAAAHEEMRVHNEREGFTKIEYRRWPATLVENGRDAAVKHALAHNYDWILQIDADMAPFPPDACLRLLNHSFGLLSHSDAIGAYCSLKGGMHLPTIDTGTGTWEPWFPGSGMVEVIRTGCAFLMCKTTAFRRFGPPWFRSKISNKPLDALNNVDNFARCKLDGRNPLADLPEWTSLLADAMQAGPGEDGIGEDSGFCDRLKNAGGRIYVDTDIAVGHVGKEIIDWRKLKEKMDKQRELVRLAIGVQG